MPNKIEHMTSPIYIFVNGGAVTNCTNAEGETVAEARVIDYDNLENGDCPVCDGRLKMKKGGGEIHCPRCGYDEGEDNALACAVAYFDKES